MLLVHRPMRSSWSTAGVVFVS